MMQLLFSKNYNCHRNRLGLLSLMGIKIDDIRIPNGKYMGAEYKEVLCKSFPEIKGLKLEGGGSQFITNSQIKVNRLINLETGEIIKFSH